MTQVQVSRLIKSLPALRSIKIKFIGDISAIEKCVTREKFHTRALFETPYLPPPSAYNGTQA